jgi:hypothetical protein
MTFFAYLLVILLIIEAKYLRKINLREERFILVQLSVQDQLALLLIGLWQGRNMEK